MERVLDRLWIGSTEDFRAPLASLGFVAVLDLRDGKHPPCEGIETHRLDNRDGDPWQPDQIENALNFVAAHLRGGKVLIACAAGMSRSASMTIAFLVRTGWDTPSAFELVRAARPRIAPATKMLFSVLNVVKA